MPTPRHPDRPRHHADAAPASAAPPSLLARFRNRLAAGDYDALIGRGLRRTLRGAAADTGLEAEIGALRLALVRLLIEEHDPARLAAGVARLTAVAVQAARMRHLADSDVDEVRAIFLRELDAFERENRLETGPDAADAAPLPPPAAGRTRPPPRRGRDPAASVTSPPLPRHQRGGAKAPRPAHRERGWGEGSLRGWGRVHAHHPHSR